MVVLTSNRTRELHDALKRRCLYHWIAFPDAERERAIIEARVPGLAEDAARVAGGGGDRRAPAAADQAAGHRRDDRLGAGREGAHRRGRRVAAGAAPQLGLLVKEPEDTEAVLRREASAL